MSGSNIYCWTSVAGTTLYLYSNSTITSGDTTTFLVQEGGATSLSGSYYLVLNGVLQGSQVIFSSLPAGTWVTLQAQGTSWAVKSYSLPSGSSVWPRAKKNYTTNLAGIYPQIVSFEPNNYGFLEFLNAGSVPLPVAYQGGDIYDIRVFTRGGGEVYSLTFAASNSNVAQTVSSTGVFTLSGANQTFNGASLTMGAVGSYLGGIVFNSPASGICYLSRLV